MDDKKYKILYNEQRVVDVQEDNGTGNTDNNMDSIEIVAPEIGIDYLDSLERKIDPIGY
jgi:hypothetical protein